MTAASVRLSGRWQLIVSTKGPDTPKWVNSISPRSEYSVFLPFFMVMLTLRRLKPISSPGHVSTVSMAESTALRGVTVWPKASAMR